MSFDQAHADALRDLADLKHENRLASEQIVELRGELARLHLLLAEHGINDPARANLSQRERQELADMDESELRTFPVGHDHTTERKETR
jgi:hypothetical protein